MSGQAEEHERTMAFCEIALGQIKALRQPATPRNYEIWYAYATGYHPSLNQKINETLGQTNEQLDETVTIRGQPHRVHQALHRSLSHTSYHVGQIVYVAKGMRGKDWNYLSIAPGQSDTFTQTLSATGQKH